MGLDEEAFEEFGTISGFLCDQAGEIPQVPMPPPPARPPARRPSAAPPPLPADSLDERPTPARSSTCTEGGDIFFEDIFF